MSFTINDAAAFLNAQAGYKVYKQESGAISYFLYTARDSDFYMMKSVVSAGVTTFTFARLRNQSQANQVIDTAWTNRAALAYQPFHLEFA